MPNQDLREPPIYVKMIDETSGNMSPEWMQWFTDIHRKLSRKNHQTITSARAVDLEARYVALDSTAGGFAITLAAPTLQDVTKTIEMTADGGNVTMALTNVSGGSAGTTCTWNDVNDVLILKSAGSKWTVIKEDGVSLT